MIIEFENKTYFVNFYHNYVERQKRNICDCFVAEPGLKDCWRGQSRRNPKDEFSRAIARRVALNRALLEAGMDHPKRTKFIDLVESICAKGGLKPKTPNVTAAAPNFAPYSIGQILKDAGEPDIVVCHI